MSALAGRDWVGAPGASDQALAALRERAPVQLPAAYLSLLGETNGGEGPLPVSPLNFCLDPAEVALESLVSGNHGLMDTERLLMIGSSGGGHYIALDTRGEPPWPVVNWDPIAGIDSLEVIAADFNSFLDLVGRE